MHGEVLDLVDVQWSFGQGLLQPLQVRGNSALIWGLRSVARVASCGEAPRSIEGAAVHEIRFPAVPLAAAEHGPAPEEVVRALQPLLEPYLQAMT